MKISASDSLYRRLRRHLDRTPVGYPATKSGVELRILEHLFTPEEAEVALELSVIPEPLTTIHKRLRKKMMLPDLERMLEPVRQVLKTGRYIPFGDHLIPPDVPWNEFRLYRARLNELIDNAKADARRS